MGAVQNKSEQKDDEWLTTVEAAAYVKMTKSALLQQIAKGNLAPDSRARPGLKLHRFRRSTLDRWLTGDNDG